MPTNQIINDVIPWTQAVSSSSQTVFDTDWTAAYATDVVVYQRGQDDEPDEITQILLESEYTVSFIGSGQTVRVTLLTPATLGDIITITRNTPVDRLNLYTNTNFVPSMLNQDTALLTLVDQERAMLNSQSVKYHLTGLNPDNALLDNPPVVPLGPNQIWAMNSSGDAIIAYDVPEGGGIATDSATFLLQVPRIGLPHAQAMSELDSGIVVSTTGTGVQLTRNLEGVDGQIAISNADGIDGNPLIGIADNASIPGTQGMDIPRGTTAQRPSVPGDKVYFRFNEDSETLEYWDGTEWASIASFDGVLTVTGTANEIDVDSTDPSNPVISLSDTINLPGTFDIQGSTAINQIINDATLASATATNIATALSIKTYINTIAQGIYVEEACYAATTANLSGYTYNNGASGVGATLTAGSNGAFTTDGVSPALNARILVKNQTTQAQNGIYVLSTVGDVSTPAVLTRATEYDEPDEIDPGDLVILTHGSTLATSSWIETQVVNTIGTDPIAFTQFTAAIPVAVPFGGTGKTTFTANAPVFGGTTSTGALQQSAAMTNGQVLIGSTGNIPTPATLTAGTGISITNGAGSITVAATADPTGGLSTNLLLMGG